jgi:N,N'-diacetylbacillosaminyl-diphospho-undecaprenol alpha-1,3-N-acetylgalactosaminyltransferase
MLLHVGRVGAVRIALVLNDDFSMWRFRRGLIVTLRRLGHTVYTLTPSGPYVGHLEALGAIHRPVPMYRFVSPLGDLRMVWALYRTLRRDRIELVHNMTVKPTTYGALAARLAGVPKVTALVSGLGIPFMTGGPGRRLMRCTVRALYRAALSLTDKVWFQNPDDLELFVADGLVDRARVVLIRGSGVDLDEVSAARVDQGALAALRRDLGLGGSGPVAAMVVARLIWSKGVREFKDAARLLAGRCPDLRFVLVGPYERGHPDAVRDRDLEAGLPPNLIALPQFRQEVREILALADIVVLPSYFREGVPRILLEALSLGKPIVTTDHPGCRETVEPGRNGHLVPVRDAGALADAIADLAADPGKRRRFGEHSRRKAELEFDERLVVRRVLREVYGLDDAA